MFSATVWSTIILFIILSKTSSAFANVPVKPQIPHIFYFLLFVILHNVKLYHSYEVKAIKLRKMKKGNNIVNKKAVILCENITAYVCNNVN